jgi:hypothetical protein
MCPLEMTAGKQVNLRTIYEWQMLGAVRPNATYPTNV